MQELFFSSGCNQHCFGIDNRMAGRVASSEECLKAALLLQVKVQTQPGWGRGLGDGLPKLYGEEGLRG